MVLGRLFGGQTQTFSTLIEENRVYVDKTNLVYNMTHKYNRVFLSRPRRFGKSLLCSTLKSYFEGRRDLFEGLAIEKLEKDWTKYPVLHFDMSGGKHLEKDVLERHIGTLMEDYEKKYNIVPSTPDSNNRLARIIKEAYAQEGQKVVVIIDEYDAPLLDVVHEEENLKSLRQVVRNFYSPLKTCDQYLHFVFLTGITKFSQLSIFSELNNLENISMLPEFAAICGITEEELLTQLSVDIDNMAEALGETREETIAELRKMYDGYHFTWPSPDVYNPFSLIRSLANKQRNPYWFDSGTPTFIIEMLRKFRIVSTSLCTPQKALASVFDAPTESMRSITPLLYQSGYLTIKGYSPAVKLYTLDIPNQEIRIGLMQSLIPNYLGYASDAGLNMNAEMQEALMEDDIERMFQLLKDFLATVPYVNNVNSGENTEGHWQQMLYIIFSLLGATCDVEVHTSKGRIDLVARTATKLYLIEVKLNQSAETAMKQIELKDYAERYALSGLPVVRVGVNFSQEERNITEVKFKVQSSKFNEGMKE